MPIRDPPKTVSRPLVKSTSFQAGTATELSCSGIAVALPHPFHTEPHCEESSEQTRVSGVTVSWLPTWTPVYVTSSWRPGTEATAPVAAPAPEPTTMLPAT